MNANKRLASIALFRELFEAKSNNAYMVLSSLIVYGMHKASLHQGSVEIVKKMLFDIFDYNIPKAVIEYTIKKHMGLKATDETFAFSTADSPVEVESQIKQNEEQHKLILRRLQDYIRCTLGQSLSEKEQERVVSSFCSYILDDTQETQYTPLINRFIVEHAKDTVLMKSLNTLKEGVFLYTGLKYTCDTLGQNGWTSPLVFFLDTEILFSAVGYNGPLFESAFMDFHNLVKEVNAKNKKGPIIKLRYFETTKDDALRFFDTARLILDGKIVAAPGKTAMNTICHGKSKGYEIREEYTRYQERLANLGIDLDMRSDYYAIENTPYNIESPELIEHFTQIHGRATSEYLQRLNFINILRKGDNHRGVERTTYWLLTANSVVFNMGLDEKLRGERGTSLATTVTFFTNKFWFKLNKGFGVNNEFPKSFNVITMAQLALLSHVNNSLTVHYEELKKDVKLGKLSDERASLVLAGLKRHDISSNDVDNDEIVSALNFVDNFSVERVSAEYEQFKQRAEEAEAKSQMQDLVINRNTAEIDQLKKEKEVLLEKEKEAKQAIEHERNKIRLRNRRIRFILKLFFILLIVATYIYLNKCYPAVMQTIVGVLVNFVMALATLVTILSFMNITPKIVCTYIKQQCSLFKRKRT